MHTNIFSLKALTFSLCVTLFSLSTTSAHALQMSLGPTVGGGTTGEAKDVVRHGSGFRAIFVPTSFDLPGRVSLGPTLGFQYLLLNTRTYDDGRSVTATYDHRIGNLGVKAAYPSALTAPLQTRGYLQAGAGIGRGKLQLNEATPASFSQNTFSGLRSKMITTEAGIEVPLRERFNLFAGLLFANLEVDQSGLEGSKKSEVSSGGAVTLLAKPSSAQSEGLSDKVTQHIWALNFGVLMGI